MPGNLQRVGIQAAELQLAYKAEISQARYSGVQFQYLITFTSRLYNSAKYEGAIIVDKRQVFPMLQAGKVITPNRILNL